MNNYQIDLTAHYRPEVLERILRVIRHRGFHITTLTMEQENQKVQLKIFMESHRTLDFLVGQLTKLPDVIQITPHA